MRCEDYPCCGHTDGLPCDWTYTSAAQAHDIEHAYCDHEIGICEAMHDNYDEGECDGDPDECPYGGCGDCDDVYEPMEDQWLDGSYEE